MINITKSGQYQTIIGAWGTWQLWFRTRQNEPSWIKVAEVKLNELQTVQRTD